MNTQLEEDAMTERIDSLEAKLVAVRAYVQGVQDACERNDVPFPIDLWNIQEIVRADGD